MKNVTVIETELRNSLPALAELINKELGFAPELKTEFIAKKYPPTIGDDKYRVQLSSEELINELGSTLVKTIFSSIKLRCWGGEFVEEGNAVWFNPKLEYTHPNGGSNGTDFMWDSLWYRVDTCTWIAGRSILNQNNEF